MLSAGNLVPFLSFPPPPPANNLRPSIHSKVANTRCNRQQGMAGGCQGKGRGLRLCKKGGRVVGADISQDASGSNFALCMAAGGEHPLGQGAEGNFLGEEPLQRCTGGDCNWLASKKLQKVAIKIPKKNCKNFDFKCGWMVP